MVLHQKNLSASHHGSLSKAAGFKEEETNCHSFIFLEKTAALKVKNVILLRLHMCAEYNPINNILPSC